MVTTIGPPRAYGPKATKYGITIHSTENTSASARDEANYAKNRTDGTSSHYYVDEREVIRSLSTAYGANHAGAPWPNAHLIAFEFCGAASWSTAKWMSHINWDAAARRIAADCVQWKIPPISLTVKQLEDHKRGVSTHDDCRRAFGHTDHTDPGPNFPEKHLLSRVAYYMGDDMELTDKITLSQLWVDRWPGVGDPEGRLSLNTSLGSTYGHSRAANEQSQESLDLLKQVIEAQTIITQRLDSLEAKIDAFSR